jgi:replicative DNA helicase
MALKSHTRPAEPLGADESTIASTSERDVSGAILRRPAIVDELRRWCVPEDFCGTFYRQIYEVALALVGRGECADLSIFAQEMHRLDPHQSIGPLASQLAELYQSVPSASSFAYHARQVRNAATLRRLKTVGEQIAFLADRPHGPAAEMLQEAAKLLETLADRGLSSEPRRLQEVLTDTLDAIDRRRLEPQRRGWKTGIESLDQQLGSFRPGELIVLAARPSVGKTAVSIAFATAAARQGCHVLFASCEQRDQELAERLLASAACVPLNSIRGDTALSTDETERLLSARDQLDPLPLWIDDEPRQTVRHIAAQARFLRRRVGLGMIVIDYLGLMDAKVRPGQKRYEVVAEITRNLKILARDMEVPVVVLAQLNRDVDSRGSNSRPRLADLRESGSIEQDSDVVLLLHRPNHQATNDANQRLEILVAKQRNGPTGEMTVRFVRDQMRFESVGVAQLPTPFERNI